MAAESLEELTKFINNTPRWGTKLSMAKEDQRLCSIRDNIVKITGFLPEDTRMIVRGWHIIHNVLYVPLCIECKSIPVKFNFNENQYREFCSTKCRNKSPIIKNRIKETVQEKYGVDNVFQVEEFKEKQRTTVQEKYGVDNVSKSGMVQDIIKENNLNRYGVTHTSQLPETKKKVTRTNNERYGTDYGLQSSSVKEKGYKTNFEKYGTKFASSSSAVKNKRIATILDRYGVEYIGQSEQIRQKITTTNIERYGMNYMATDEFQQHLIRFNIEHYGVTNVSQKDVPTDSLVKLNDKQFLITEHHTNKLSLSEIADNLSVHVSTVSDYFKKWEIEVKLYQVSAAEKQILAWLESNNIHVISRCRNVINGELDLYIPSHNVAIEYNGLYWHSDAHISNTHHHYNKMIQCRNNGIRLITIFENEWLGNSGLVLEKLANILHITQNTTKIYGRKCDIRLVDTDQKKVFFDTYHIQGNGPSSINYGLFYNNVLVACMGFVNNKDHFVLNRYATSRLVVGGFTKLLARFEADYDSPTIISFADLRWSQGSVYYNSGFTSDKIIPPDYFWTKGNKLWHKFNWRHNGNLKKLSNYDANKSESENMYSHGFHKLWDCGKIKFTKNSK